MQDEGVVSRHLEHMKVRNLRRWTIYNRQRTLARLAAWSGGPILYLTEDQLKAWQTARSRVIQSEPLRTETSHVRQFFRWAVLEEFRADDPTLRLPMPRVHRHLPRPISDRQLGDAMAAADAATKAILALAAFAGLRACEISQLDWNEIGIFDASPHVRIEEGKGGNGRLVPLSAALAAILLELPDRRGPVVPRLDGQSGPTPAHRISMRANVYLHEMGIAATLHQCRHRFATVTYQACQDIRAVQDLLGHASPTTTAIYAATASAVAVGAVEAAGSLTNA